MTALCNQLSPFVDGAVFSARDADTFRDHLATCEQCAQELHSVMMLEALEGGLGPARGAGGGEGNVQSIRTAPRWLSRVIAPMTLAAAAGLALWIGRSPRDPEVVAASDGPVPAYSLVATGGDRATRSLDAPAAGPLAVRRDSRLELVLRPSKPVVGAVSARGFLVQGADVRAWSPSMEVSADGAIRVAGPAGDLLRVPAGAWDVVLVVGRADSLPSDPQVAARALHDRSSAHPWQLLVTHVQLTDGP